MMKKNYIIFAISIFFLIISSFLFIKQFYKADAKKFSHNILHYAGITINGPAPYDIIVHNDHVYNRVFSAGSLGLGESYMDGWWDCNALDELFFHIACSNAYHIIPKNLTTFCTYFKAKLFNLQSQKRAFQVGEEHYDLGNDLFIAMLDKLMLYSCGYWKNAHNLDEAQEHKCELICKKTRHAGT